MNAFPKNFYISKDFLRGKEKTSVKEVRVNLWDEWVFLH